jgi:hypothetical protein
VISGSGLTRVRADGRFYRTGLSRPSRDNACRKRLPGNRADLTRSPVARQLRLAVPPIYRSALLGSSIFFAWFSYGIGGDGSPNISAPHFGRGFAVTTGGDLSRPTRKYRLQRPTAWLSPCPTWCHSCRLRTRHPRQCQYNWCARKARGTPQKRSEARDPIPSRSDLGLEDKADFAGVADSTLAYERVTACPLARIP